MTPAVDEGAGSAVGVFGVGPELYTTGFGVVKLEWLSTLKNSARNCARSRSWIVVLLATDRSSSESPGPVSVSRPRLPNVPGYGALKAAGLNHCFTVLA